MIQDDPQSPDDAAVQWFVLLSDRDATDEERAACAAWRASDPAHETAWRGVLRLSGGLDIVAARSGLIPSAPQHPAVSVPFPRSPAPPARPASRARWSRVAAARGWRGAAVAATLLLGLGLGWGAMPAAWFADHATGTGERRIVRLDDGSEVELGPATALDVAFLADRRTVTLLDGEAFFTVAPDQARPFTVAAGGGTVTVLGTAFDVKIADAVSVAVTHNSVEVAVPGHPAVRVGEGEAVRYEAGGISRPRPVDAGTVLAWRQGQIVFHDAPLREVVAELDRYHPGHIQLLGKELEDRRITMVLDAARIDAGLDRIAGSLNLRIYRVGGVLTAILPPSAPDREARS